MEILLPLLRSASCYRQSNQYPRYGLKANVTVSVDGAEDDDTFFFTAYDSNVARNGANFSNLRDANQTMQYFSEAVDVKRTLSDIYVPSNNQNKRDESLNRIGLPGPTNIPGGKSYLSGFATVGNASTGVEVDAWSSGAAGNLVTA